MLSKIRMSLRAKMLLLVMTPTVGMLILVGLVATHQLNRMLISNARVVGSSYSSGIMAEVRGMLNRDMDFSRGLSRELSSIHVQTVDNLSDAFSDIFRNKLNEDSRYSALWIFLEDESLGSDDRPLLIRSAFSVAINRSTGEFIEGIRPIGTDQYVQAYVRAISSNQESVIEPHLQAYDDATKAYIVSVCSPVRIGSLRGFVAVDLPVVNFQDLIDSDKPYPNATAEILSANGIVIAHSNPFLIGQTIHEERPELELKHNLSDKLIKGLPYSFQWNEGRGSYFSVLTPSRLSGTNTHWTLKLTVPISDIFNDARGFKLLLIWGLVLILALISFLIWQTAIKVSQPLIGLTKVIQSLAQGDITSNQTIDLNGNNEINSISEALREHIKGLNETEQFAREIGKGNLEASYQLHGEKDTLGKALIEMQSSLAQAQTTQQEKIEEEHKQNWAAQGVAIFSDILRRNTNNIDEFGFSIIQKMVEYTNAIQGGLFIVDEMIEDESREEETLSMVASYAYDRRRYINKVVTANEGLIGRCYREGKTIILTDIPKEYIKITSGLGETPPQFLILIPLKANNSVLGVLEIASLNRFEKYEVDFMERLAESIGSTIQAVRVSIRTNALLSKSQQQAEEMAAQEEEMRQNMEELQATQEDMERKRLEQEILQEELKKEQALLTTLLNGIPDYIYFKDLSSHFIRASKSMLSLFQGYKSPDELIGKSDFDFHTQDLAQLRFDDEQQIIKGIKPPMINQVDHEVLPDGREQWVSSTKMPLTDRDGNVIGLWGISKIITEIKKAELEAKAKTQEALEFSDKFLLSRNEYKGLISAIDRSTIMIEFAPDGTIELANQPAQDLFGLTELQLLGIRHSEILRSDDDDEVKLLTLWNDLRKGVVKERVFRGVINQRERVIYQTYSPVKNAKGDVYKVIVILTELHEGKGSKEQ